MPAGFAAKKAERLARKRITQYGPKTTVNGSAPSPAVWTEAGVARIQTFLDQNEWNRAAYDVHFAALALDVATSLRNGSELVRVKDGWRAVVRAVDPHVVGETTAAVTCLVVLTTE